MADNNYQVSEEKFAHWVENGFTIDELTDTEKDYLLHGGLDELLTVRESLSQPVESLDRNTIDKIMRRHFPETVTPLKDAVVDIWLQVREQGLALVKEFSEWHCLEVAPVYRGMEEESRSGEGRSEKPAEKNALSFRKEIGKLTVHLDINRKQGRCVDIVVRLRDISKREQSSFKVALIQGERCLETIKTDSDSSAVFSDIEVGNYSLQLHDSFGEVTSIAVRMES
jgi:hypothetical protein